MRLEWVLAGREESQCSTLKSPDTCTVCELPWDHIVLQNGEPARVTSHMGRSATGTWFSWE